MSTPTQTKQWLLNIKPKDFAILDGPNQTFRLETTKLPDLGQDQVLVKSLYLSNDPAQRGWIASDIAADRHYVPPVQEGEPMRARALGQILESNATDEKLAKGTYVLAQCNWVQYVVMDAKACVPVKKIDGLELTHYLGALGGTGLTAYYGLKEIVQAGQDDTVVVSGAAGATGSMAVQIAKKILGCKRVVGMAGSDEKCRWVEKIGADVCLNYKSETFEQDLIRATDGFVEVYFDNVGGEILDMMLTRMKRFGRIAACGAISNYNSADPTGLKNYFQVIMNRLTIKGFIVIDYLNKAREAQQVFVEAWKEGKLEIGDENETVVDTKFEDIPKTWMKLFEGANTGKLITKLV